MHEANGLLIEINWIWLVCASVWVCVQSCQLAYIFMCDRIMPGQTDRQTDRQTDIPWGRNSLRVDLLMQSHLTKSNLFAHNLWAPQDICWKRILSRWRWSRLRHSHTVPLKLQINFAKICAQTTNKRVENMAQKICPLVYSDPRSPSVIVE